MDQEPLGPTDLERTAGFALDLATQMLVNGGEISRAEDTMTRVCRAYNCNVVHMFTITTLVILTVARDEGEPSYTAIRRVPGYSYNLTALEELNRLSRHMCQDLPPLEEGFRCLREIQGDTVVRPTMSFWGGIITAFFLAMFFGGVPRDGLCAGLLAVLLYVLDHYIYRPRMNRVVTRFISSMLAGCGAILLIKAGIGVHLDMVNIGFIMVLIPGIPLTNSIRDLLGGDIISGLLRFVDSMLQALAIAGGLAVAILFFGGGAL